MIRTFTSITEWQKFRQQQFFNHKSIGFVPTMGNLHSGHESLLARAKQENDFTVLSIFVNPTQFNDTKDFTHYPRTVEQDKEIAERNAVDFILLPEYQDLYPDDYSFQIKESVLSELMEGQMRPGHFDGMLTIVMKLLLLVKPKKTYFGEKDFQQLQLVKKMARAFFLDMEIISCMTIRDKHGLALSSRNSRLTEQQYHLATRFPEILQKPFSVDEIKDELVKAGFVIDYVVDYDGRRFGAVRVGDIRLIDNIEVTQ